MKKRGGQRKKESEGLHVRGRPRNYEKKTNTSHLDITKTNDSTLRRGKRQKRKKFSGLGIRGTNVFQGLPGSGKGEQR